MTHIRQGEAKPLVSTGIVEDLTEHHFTAVTYGLERKLDQSDAEEAFVLSHNLARYRRLKRDVPQPCAGQTFILDRRALRNTGFRAVHFGLVLAQTAVEAAHGSNAEFPDVDFTYLTWYNADQTLAESPSVATLMRSFAWEIEPELRKLEQGVDSMNIYATAVRQVVGGVLPLIDMALEPVYGQTL